MQCEVAFVVPPAQLPLIGTHAYCRQPCRPSTDNTARKEIEEERKEAGAERKQTNVDLEKASLAKDRFLASMSHELRTPLNVVIGFTGTLLMRLPGPLTDDQESQLRTGQTSARQLLSLINDLLDLAKIESGNVALHFESASCQSVIDEVSSALSPLAVAKGLTFDVIPAPHDCVVQTDRRALSQILINLTNNAIKFTETGHVSLEVAHREREAQSSVEIRIRDTGRGIPPEDEARLFQAFEQIENSTSRRDEGTGLARHFTLDEYLVDVPRLRWMVVLPLIEEPRRRMGLTIKLRFAPCRRVSRARRTSLSDGL